MSHLPKPPAPPLPGSEPPPAPAAAPADELSSPADPNKVEGTEPPAVIDTMTAPAPAERHCAKCDVLLAVDVPCPKHEQVCGHCGVINVRMTQSCTGCGAVLPAMPIVLEPKAKPAPAPSSSQEPVSGSVTMPPVAKPAGLSAVEEGLLAAEEPEEVIISDPPAADTVKVPPLAPPPGSEAPAPAAEKDPARKSWLLAALAGMGTMMRTISLIFIMLILGGLALHHSGLMRIKTPTEPKVVEKVVVREVPVPAAPTKKALEKKTVEVKAPPVKKVHRHRRSRPAPAEKEITFEAKDLVHVWHGPVDHLLDKDDE